MATFSDIIIIIIIVVIVIIIVIIIITITTIIVASTQSFGGFKAVGSKFSRMTIIALMTSFCKEESFKIVLRIRSVCALQLLIDN